jgi:PAS domain S-box-containing protein
MTTNRNGEVSQRSSKADGDLRPVIDTVPALVWSARPDGSRDFLNQRWLEYTGLSLEQGLGWGWKKVYHPEDLAAFEENWSTAVATGQPLKTEARLRNAGGEFRWFSVCAMPLRDARGNIVKWYGTNTDIGDRKRAEGLVAGEKRLLEMVARSDALAPILEALCRLCEELSGGTLVSILLLSADGKSLRHGAAPSLPQRYTEAIDGALIGPRAGSCGTAAYRKEMVIVSDIETDPLWADYRHLALAEGLRACWSAPIFSTRREVLGTFALYSRQPGTATSEQHSIVEQFAQLASIAIERAQAQESLRRSEAYLAEAQHLSRTGSFGWRVATGDLVWSTETFCIMGVDRATKPSLELVLRRVHPEDVELVQETIDRATRDGTNFDFEHRLLMPDGAVKHLHVVARPTKTDTAELEFVGAVMDVTERKQAQEAMRAAKARFEGILEIAEDAIISVDANQRIVLFNQGAEKVFGYAAAEVAGKSLDILLPQRFTHAHRGHIEAFAKSPEVSRLMGQRREVFGRRKDGSEFPAEASISKLDLCTEVFFTVILRDITERKKAAEALRASEHLARGQLDALTRTLDALAQESDSDRLLEHVLRTIVEQTKAHSIAAWDRNEDGARFDMIAVIEDGEYQTREEAVHPARRLSMLPEHHPVWREVLRSGQHGMMNDIDKESARMCVGSGDWHQMVEDINPDPAFTILMNHLREMGVRTVLFVPILIAGKVAGTLAIRLQDKRTFRREEIELTRALAHQAMLAIQLMRLSGESRQAAVMAERNRMARDIHDTLAQGFTGVIMQLEAARGATTQGDIAEATNRIERASDLARSSLGEARRSVRALRLRSLRDGKLFVALDGLLKRMTDGTSLNAEFHTAGDEQSIPAGYEEDLLHIAQEALTNAVKHANARNFSATLSIDADKIQLHLVDDGQGFDPQKEHDGFGLTGMKERVDRMGGEFIIRTKQGVGTEILVELKNAHHEKA